MKYFEYHSPLYTLPWYSIQYQGIIQNTDPPEVYIMNRFWSILINFMLLPAYL